MWEKFLFFSILVSMSWAGHVKVLITSVSGQVFVMECITSPAKGRWHGRSLPIAYNVIYLQAETTVNPVLNGHSKIDKTNVLKTDHRLIQVKGIA